MKVLVTGATGCLGRRLVGALSTDSDCEIFRTARRIREDDRSRSVDLTDPLAVLDLVQDVRPNLILHCAGGKSGDLDSDLRINASSGRWLMEAVLAAGVRSRILLIGSAAEYGPVIPEENPIAEDRPLRPVSVYGVSKAMQTMLAYHFTAERGSDVVVARLFNLYGEAMAPNLFVGRVQIQIQEVLRGQRTRIDVGHLDSIRDYIDAADAARQILVIARRGLRGEVYNVGTGKPTLMRDLLRRMLLAVKLDMNVVQERTANARRLHEVPVIFADMQKTNALMRSDGDP
jgi:nucleoside-diphosphate-sugar epimerase